MSPFIVIDGADGGGKTTQMDMLADYLGCHQIPFHRTAEPSKGELGVILRKYLKDSTVPHELDALLFAADRIHHYYYEVKPALDAHQVVISDRYKDSSIAYQTAQGLPRSWITDLNSKAPPADLTILLDIDPTIAMERIAHGRTIPTEKFETVEFQTTVRSVFLDIAKQDPRYVVLDATCDPKTLHAQILRILKTHFGDVFKYGIY